MPGRVPAPARRGDGGARRAAAAAGLAALVALGAGLGARALAEDAKPLDQSQTVQVGDIAVKIAFPTGEERWAGAVKKVFEKGGPALIQAAGKLKRDALDVKFAASTAETDGFEAALKGDAILVRKRIDRMGRVGGFKSYWPLYAMARLWADKAVKPEWLRGGLAHLAVYHALKKAPVVYDARAFRAEIAAEMEKADDAPLEQWMPAPPGGGAAGAAVPEQFTEVPQIGKAFGFLYEADERLDGKVMKAFNEAAQGEAPVGVKEFIAAVAKLNDAKPVDEYFSRWAVPEAGTPPKLDKTDLMDSDLDGLLNFEEELKGTDKTKVDTDGDGVSDGDEVDDGTDPKVKDAAKSKFKVDGDPKEWLRVKKFQFQDLEGDAKKDGDKAITGADLLKVNFAHDGKNIYMMIQCDSFANADVTYNICIDCADDGVDIESKEQADAKKVSWNYYIGFRTNGTNPPSTWIGDTHNAHREADQIEWKNNGHFKVAIKDNVAELRVPMSAFDLSPKIVLMGYTTAKDGALIADSVLRQVLELEKWKQ